MPQTPANNQTKSTQNSLLINEIKDGIVVMGDGSMRAVILASAINFDLMSTQEQDAVEFSYQGFLNSLHFPIQIIIKSQKIDLDNYLESLGKLRSSQSNPLLGELMDDYILNIKGLIEEVNIMDKQFYVVVPFFPPLAVSKANVVSGIANVFKPINVITVSAADYENYKRELTQRVQQVTSGLLQMGIRAIPLNTQELVDLFYSSYNPDVAANQKLVDSNQLQGAAVTRGGGPLQSQAAPAAVRDVRSETLPPAAAPPAAPPAAAPPAAAPAANPYAQPYGQPASPLESPTDQQPPQPPAPPGGYS